MLTLAESFVILPLPASRATIGFLFTIPLPVAIYVRELLVRSPSKAVALMELSLVTLPLAMLTAAVQLTVALCV